MGSEAMFAWAGLIALGVAQLTGALWGTHVVSAVVAFADRLQPQGRHAMPH
jgi:hypothetical protein